MIVRLFLERKGKRVWSTQMRGSEATIGRAVGCSVRIPSSEISRLHCRLRVENGLLTVEDLESVNGTFINGTRIRGIQTVRPGDRLALGSVTFAVEYPLTPEAMKRLGGGEEFAVLEEVEDAPVPAAEPLDVVEEVDADAFILDEDDEMHLPEGGDFHDFLVELDDNDQRGR